jgi:hypothetical protein
MNTYKATATSNHEFAGDPEVHVFESASLADAKEWVIAHCDCSRSWNVEVSIEKTEQVIVSYWDLSPEWKEEARRNLDEFAEEASYFEPDPEHNPKEHILWDLSECMRVDNEEYDGVIGISNTGAIAVKLSDCGEMATTWLLS